MMCGCGEKMRSLAPFVLRVVLGLVFAFHGYQKLQMGVPMVAGFLGQIGFPFAETFAVLLITAELGGGILLILGVWTHWVAKILAFVALVAFFTVHMTHGFFLSGGGYEYIILIFAGAFSLMITGAGKWSIDGMLRHKGMHGHPDHDGHDHMH